jgi:hypothetical protein
MPLPRKRSNVEASQSLFQNRGSVGKVHGMGETIEGMCRLLYLYGAMEGMRLISKKQKREVGGMMDGRSSVMEKRNNVMP